MVFVVNSSEMDRCCRQSTNIEQSATTRPQHCDRLGVHSPGGVSVQRQSPGGSTSIAARRVSKKYRSTREYMRLKAIVPAVSGQKSVSKLTVVEEAIRYIDQLHATLATRMMNDSHTNTVGNAEVESSSFEPDEFVRRLCFGSYLNERHLSAASSRRHLTAAIDHNRCPLAERMPLNDRKAIQTSSSRPTDCTVSFRSR